MVNMYGAGKAFNLRYQQTGNHRFVQRQPAFRAPQPGMFGCHGHQHGGPTNVTINNGPQGFWGFMSGLFGGLFGGGGMMGGFGPFNQMGMSPFGMVNQGLNGLQQKQDQSQAQQLQNLKTLFPKYNIVSEDGGKFSTIGKNGDVISGDYEEMKAKLAADSEKKSVDDNKKKDAADNDPKKDVAGNDPKKDVAGNDPKKDVVDNNPKKDNADNNQDGWSAAGKNSLDGFKGQISVNDFAKGGGVSINGATVLGASNEQGFPKSIQIKGYNYNFVKVDDNGKAIYKSVDGKGDEYALEKNKDGSFALNQRDGMLGAGSADITSKGKVPGGQSPQPVKTNDEMIKDSAILTKNADGSVKVRIPAPWKEAGEVTIPANKAAGKTEAELKDMALQEIRNPKQKNTPSFQFGNWNNS